MRSLPTWMLALAAAIGLCGCPWAKRTPTPVGPAADVLAKAGLQYYWRAEVSLQCGEAIVKMYRLDENLYCMTDLNRVIALDAVRGTFKWTVAVADPGDTVFRPCHADSIVLSEKASSIAEILDRRRSGDVEPFDAVLFNTLSKLIVIDRATGRLVRRGIDFDFAANTGGATNETYFFVGATSGRYCGILIQEAVKVWTLSTGDILKAPLELHGKRLYVGGEDGYFYATRVSDRGEQAWKQKTDGPITAAFHVDARGCFVPSEDNRLYAFNPASGRQLWEPFVCQGPLRDAVQVGGQSVFQYARGDRLYALDLATGRLRWDMPSGRVVLANLNAETYVLDASNNLIVVNEMTGERKASLGILDYDVFLPNTTAEAIYMATASGNIACVRTLRAGYLRLHQMQGRTEGWQPEGS